MIDGIFIGLPLIVAFQLKGHDGETVEENDHIHALVITCPNFFHNGEAVFLILGVKARIELGGGLIIHQLQYDARSRFNAMFQYGNQAVFLGGYFLIDVTDDGFFGTFMVYLPQGSHFVRLGIL